MKKEQDRLATGTLRADLNGHRVEQPPLTTEGITVVKVVLKYMGVISGDV